MAQQAPIGHFEQLVLTAVISLGEDAYGVTIHDTVVELYGRRISLGAVYATLDRLEDKGYVTSWLSEPTPERGGRSKRYFKLKADGERALRESAQMARRVCDRLEDVWGTRLWNPGRSRLVILQ